MPRGNDQQTKVHYKGTEDDFVVFVEGAKILEEWKSDKSIPLAQVVGGWKIFVTHKHGVQGIHDEASNGALESEFGTHKEEEVIKQILEKGTVQESENRERQGDTNITKGGTVAH
ncbi:putative RNA binding protein [Melanomma pulvis-pyrius CBS 109.77]|uniref:Putative RNA binding protein n=1 Tax=Melanomma pulvis-pyrius CBS 109.77 TaxID=1314802 RepID=A0A6A6XAN2_9PLEO|nr:putative RNA binding protein [Melanomma pulvis-pyrius CBS 109.77]